MFAWYLIHDLYLFSKFGTSADMRSGGAPGGVCVLWQGDPRPRCGLNGEHPELSWHHIQSK